MNTDLLVVPSAQAWDIRKLMNITAAQVEPERVNRSSGIYDIIDCLRFSASYSKENLKRETLKSTILVNYVVSIRDDLRQADNKTSLGLSWSAANQNETPQFIEIKPFSTYYSNVSWNAPVNGILSSENLLPSSGANWLSFGAAKICGWHTLGSPFGLKTAVDDAATNYVAIGGLGSFTAYSSGRVYTGHLMPGLSSESLTTICYPYVVSTPANPELAPDVSATASRDYVGKVRDDLQHWFQVGRRELASLLRVAYATIANVARVDRRPRRSTLQRMMLVHGLAQQLQESTDRTSASIWLLGEGKRILREGGIEAFDRVVNERLGVRPQNPAVPRARLKKDPDLGVTPRPRRLTIDPL